MTRPRAGPPRASGRVSPTDRPATVPEVSIVVPTLNEVDNIEVLIDRIDSILGQAGAGIDYEVVVVDDDSADGTWRRAEARAQVDERVRVIRRVGRRGLSSAVLAGMAIARGEVLVVIDADLQHDERRIPDLIGAVRDGADVALGSREIDGGGYGPFGRGRLIVSRIGAGLARRAIGVEVSDPMSGFFAVSRSRYRHLSGDLNPRGFKILLEFLSRGDEPAVREIGYVFGPRVAGSTKLDGRVVLAFVVSLIDLTVARRLGRRSRPRPGGR